MIRAHKTINLRGFAKELGLLGIQVQFGWPTFKGLGQVWLGTSLAKLNLGAAKYLIVSYGFSSGFLSLQLIAGH